MKCVIRALFALVVFVLFVVGIYGALEPVNEAGSHEPVLVSKRNYVATARNLSTLTKEDEDSDDNGEGGGGEGTGDGGDGGDNSGGGYGGDGGDGNDNNIGDGSMNRIGAGNTECTKDNILVFQGSTSPMPNGIPTYTVEIQNVCLSGSCSISNIHLSCGWFSSARLINPRIFRRIEYDDCLVNDGEAVNPGEALSFQYANTFKYPLSVSSVAC